MCKSLIEGIILDNEWSSSSSSKRARGNKATLKMYTTPVAAAAAYDSDSVICRADNSRER